MTERWSNDDNDDLISTPDLMDDLGGVRSHEAPVSRTSIELIFWTVLFTILIGIAVVAWMI